jgi:hypothetical protein
MQVYAVGVNAASEPIEVWRPRWRRPWPGGLYVLAIELYADRVTFRVFTSRPIEAAELLDRLHPFDRVGTEFAPLPAAEEVIDGRGVIEYAPAPVDGLKWLGLEDKAGPRLVPYN